MENFIYDHLIRNLNLVLRTSIDQFIQENMKYKPLAAIATPLLIIVGAYVAFQYTKKSRKNRCNNNNKVVYTRSMSLGALHGGKLAMQRLIDYHHARADSASLSEAETELRTLLAQDQPDFNKLQSTVAKLEMSGKEDAAVKILQREVERAKCENRSHEAYEFEMLLVETLIYKGDFLKALNCECLEHEEISDARRPLYKAIIHMMLNDQEEASRCWDEFVEVRSYLQSPTMEDEQFHKDMTSFDEFDKLVNILKNDIANAYPRKMLRL